jgi:hypothetical protein
MLTFGDGVQICNSIPSSDKQENGENQWHDGTVSEVVHQLSTNQLGSAAINSIVCIKQPLLKINKVLTIFWQIWI